MLASNNTILLTFQKSQFKIIDFQSKKLSIINIDSEKNDDNLGFVLAGSISNCKSYICVSDDLKGLYLYGKNESDWGLLKKCSIERRCSNIKFSHDNKFIIIADKSGYVLRVPLDFENHESIKEDKLKWIVLGHISVLVDFDIHPEQKFIATADRDEKIRVSFYPNCFEIHGFFLGHSKFVSQVKFTDDGKRLISAGADGYVIIWDLQTRKELYKHCYFKGTDDDRIPIVTRMFIDDNIFLFFKNESYAQILTVTESDGIMNVDCKTVDIGVCVSDVAALFLIENQSNFVVVGDDNKLSLFSFIWGSDSNLLLKVDSWINNIDINDCPVTKRNMFLETLPKVPVDKTGLQVYYELKEKRLKLNDNNNKSLEDMEDDE